MSDPVFVVLRAHSDTVQTVGPAGQAFTSFEEADAFAKEMRDRSSESPIRSALPAMNIC